MWREVGRSAAAAGHRVPRVHVSRFGPPPNGSFRLGCCRNRMTSVHSQGSSVSRRQNWIRAWDSGEPATSHSAAQAIECAALVCSRVADIPSMATVASGSLALAWLHDRVSTRLHALRRMAVSRLKMLHFSLCKIARSEPSRVGAGTWRRQVQWKANPRCRWVRVEHESTRLRTKGATARMNMSASHYSVG